MDTTNVRLQMIVSEPWDFGSGPIEMSVTDAVDDTQWLVDIIKGWPNVVDAVLSSRYEGRTLFNLQRGEEVIANLSAKLDGRSRGLIGTVRLVS
jgi:hypothetical protein